MILNLYTFYYCVWMCRFHYSAVIFNLVPKRKYTLVFLLFVRPVTCFVFICSISFCFQLGLISRIKEIRGQIRRYLIWFQMFCGESFMESLYKAIQAKSTH